MIEGTHMLHFAFFGLLIAGIPPQSLETPNRQPQLAASGDVVALVYGSGKSVMFAKSTDGGRKFQKSVRIAEVPVLPLGRHRGPRVVFVKNTIVVTAIGGTSVATGPHAHGLASDGNLQSWRSTDGGKTWSTAVTVNDAPGAAREGLHALAANADGTLAAVWLDLRTQGTRLYGATSSDGGMTWSKNIKIYESPDGTVCQCCHPSIVATGPGEFAIMFRNVLSGSRDMYVARMKAGQSIGAPAKLGTGTWAINACPMDGGGIALKKGSLISAWRRDGEIFLATPGEAEKPIAKGKDVVLATSGPAVLAAWTDGGINSYVSGRIVRLSDEGAFPTVIGMGDGSALVAWEEKGAISIHRVPPGQ
jgi:hypothetical protein